MVTATMQARATRRRSGREPGASGSMRRRAAEEEEEEDEEAEDEEEWPGAEQSAAPQALSETPSKASRSGVDGIASRPGDSSLEQRVASVGSSASLASIPANFETARRHAFYHRLAGYLTHARPTHSHLVHSPFDKEAPSQNYRGFLNLCMLLLFVHNLRLFLENAARYGLRVEMPGRGVPANDWWWFGVSLALVPVHYAIVFTIEKAAVAARPCAKKNLPADRPESDALRAARQTWPRNLHILYLAVQMISSCYIVRRNIWHPFVGFIALAVQVVTFLKLTSFVATNGAMRSAAVSGYPLQDASFYQSEDEARILFREPHWPRNLTPGNLLYFAFAPTLCYQTSYPRSPRFRLLFFTKRVAEFCFMSAVMYFLIEQYSSITLANAMKDLMGPESAQISTAQWAARAVERILKISISCVFIWLMMFYSFFHSYLNALAELLRFGDREFYSSWWNSCSLSTYWKTWNKPVYNHFKRHIYLPCVKAGMSHQLAVFVTFLVSALLHELLVGLPIHALYGWAFFGMLGQVPLIIVTAPLEKRKRVSTLGNIIFWMSFCIIGQPVMVMLYYRAWATNNQWYSEEPPSKVIPVWRE